MRQKQAGRSKKRLHHEDGAFGKWWQTRVGGGCAICQLGLPREEDSADPVSQSKTEGGGNGPDHFDTHNMRCERLISNAWPHMSAMHFVQRNATGSAGGKIIRINEITSEAPSRLDPKGNLGDARSAFDACLGGGIEAQGRSPPRLGEKVGPRRREGERGPSHGPKPAGRSRRCHDGRWLDAGTHYVGRRRGAIKGTGLPLQQPHDEPVEPMKAWRGRTPASAEVGRRLALSGRRKALREACRPCRR
jgi:hypothetical protein